jgi:hypothetical protein
MSICSDVRRRPASGSRVRAERVTGLGSWRSIAPESATKHADLQAVFYGSDGTRTRDLRRDLLSGIDVANTRTRAGRDCLKAGTEQAPALLDTRQRNPREPEEDLGCAVAGARQGDRQDAPTGSFRDQLDATARVDRVEREAR